MSYNAKYVEIEFKYRADHVDHHKFMEFAGSLMSPTRQLLKYELVKSYDYYYKNTNKDFKVEFIRHRNGEHPELTLKEKTVDANNNVRKEIDLQVGDNSIETVSKFANLLGFEFNFRIWKECYIFTYEDFTLVLYEVLDQEGGKNLANFLEIEANKQYNWESEAKAYATVTGIEARLTDLGIKPQNRMKRSLWEIFKR